MNYNGDWRSNDREELKVIFRLSEYELDIICLNMKVRDDNMDNLTVQKKLKLISDCIAVEDSVSKLHIDVRKMYVYLAEQAANSETSNDIKSLEIAKITLDFLVRGVNII